MVFSILQLVFFSIKAYISLIRLDQTMSYWACKTCNKKVTEAIGSGYWCEGCQKNDEECSLRHMTSWDCSHYIVLLELHSNSSAFLMSFLLFFRYILVVRASDASGEAYISTFNEEAERIIGCSADELDKLKSQV